MLCDSTCVCLVHRKLLGELNSIGWADVANNKAKDIVEESDPNNVCVLLCQSCIVLYGVCKMQRACTHPIFLDFGHDF